MLVKLFSAALQGIDATVVTIEVNSSRGIKFFLVVLFATVLIMDMIKHTVKLLEDTSIMVQESKIQN